MSESSPDARFAPVIGARNPRAALVPALVLACACFQTLATGCSPAQPSAISPLAAPPSGTAENFSPDVVCDPSTHEVLLAWIAGDSTGGRIWFSRSADKGATWTAPVPVTPLHEPVRLEPESSPQMVCDEDGRIGIGWSIWVESDGRASRQTDLRFAHSLDGGRNWSVPATINDDTTSSPGSQSFHGIAVQPNGELFAAWLDSRTGTGGRSAVASESSDVTIWLARSGDSGAHWGPNAAAWSGAVPNGRVSLVVDPSGEMFAAFRKHYPGQIRDVVLARPGGPPARLHEDAWRVPECPPAGPAMALSRDGTLRLAWYTGAPGRTGVWFRQSLPELLDSTVAPLRILVDEALPVVHVGIGEAGIRGTLIACDMDSTGANQLTLVRVESSGRRVVEHIVLPGTLGASYPSVGSERVRKTAYVAWTRGVAGHRELRLARWDVGR